MLQLLQCEDNIQGFSMISLVTFQDNGMDVFDEGVLDTAIIEINNFIKQNAIQFRMLIDLQAESVDAKIYKNAIIRYYLNAGYKVVGYPTYLYIDWGRVNVYQQTTTFVRPVTELGNHFIASDVYLALTDNKDMRKISFRTLQYQVNKEIKAMILSGRTTSIISLGVNTTIAPMIMNNMFAPDLALYSHKNGSDVHLTFTEGGNLKITMYEQAEEYTDIPVEILFGTRQI